MPDYTDALNKAIEIFVSYSEDNLSDVMSNALLPVAEAADLDRILFYRVWEKESHYAGEIYRWDRAAGAVIPVDEELKVLPVFGALKHWISMMSDNACLSLRRSGFNEDEAAFLNPRGIMSFFIVPVFTERELWGVAAFIDYRNERDFDGNCAAMLHSVARLWAAIIIREEKTTAANRALDAFKQREKVMEDLNSSATEKQMTILNSILNGLDINICATVPETGEILFINDALKNQYGLKDDKTGQLCYKVFQDGMSERCDFCPNYVLEKDPKAVVRWEQNEPLVNRIKQKTARLIDWPGGAKAHLETAVDITEARHLNDLLQKVNLVAAIMLQSNIESFAADLLRSMEIMAGAVGADRMFIWKNFIKDEKLHCYQIYEWSGGAKSQSDYPLAIETCYSDDIPGWEEVLSRGDCINGIVSEMSEHSKAALQPQGILSILIAPMFTNNEFWGFIGFDDCRSERVFPEKHEIILRSSGQMIANALSRHEETEKAHKAEERIKLMLDAMPLGCQILDQNLVSIDCNEAAVKLFGFKDKDEYHERWLLDIFPEYQPDGQLSSEKRLMYMKEAIEKGRCTFKWMHTTKDGALLPTEITLSRVEYEDSFVLVGYTRDLREIIKMTESIQSLETEMDKIYLDPLTNIYNRRFLDKNLRRIIRSLSRSGSMLSIMMIDIDNFKEYNDTYGHDEGDKCLKLIAKTLANNLIRADDYIVRYGGEEFAVILPNTDEKGARLLADRLLENVRSRRIPHEKSRASCVTISIGVATGKAKHTQSGLEYIKRADKMLYKSKREGRNRYNFAVV